MHAKDGIIKTGKVIAILILFPVLISAQHFKLGLDAELSYIRIISTKGNESIGLAYDSFIPITFNLIIGYNFNKNLTVQTHIGKTIIAVEFSGFEVGLNGIYHYNKKFYASAGILQHSNEGGSGGNSYGVTYASLFMLTAGVGYYTSKYFALELNFYYPTKRKEIIGYNPLYYSEGFNPRWNFYYMLRLGFVFALEQR